MRVAGFYIFFITVFSSLLYDTKNKYGKSRFLKTFLDRDEMC